MRLVDAHHHLWDLAAVEYPWLNARGVRRFFGDPTPIQRDYGVADLRADARPHELVASVHVQVGCRPGRELDETRWLQAVGERDGLPTAIVAAVDLTAPDAVSRLREHGRSDRVRGVRQIVGREPADDERTGAGRVLDDPAFAAGLRALAAAGLSFDLQLNVPQMPRAAALLEAVPELPVALCHCGSPWDRTASGLAEWRRGLERLARLPRSVCKLSGLSMFEPAWTDASFVSIARAVLDTFGPERTMFGSNYPVDGLHRGYGEIVEATRRAVEPHGPGALARVFGDTAREFYRLA
ncbi:MAG: amidohydrolase family protein [Pseudomonadota bacterium]